MTDRHIQFKEKFRQAHYIIMYFAVNILFVTPIVIFTVFADFFNELFNRIDLSPTVYIVLMIEYYFLKLTYVHIILCVLFLIFFGREIFKNKKILYLVVILADISVNVFWLICGVSYTVQ